MDEAHAFDTRIRSNRLLNFLSLDIRDAIRRSGTVAPMVQGEVFANPGEMPTRVQFVLDGAISMVALLRDGDGVEAGMVGREGAQGAHSVLTGLPVFTQAICQVSGHVLRVDADTFRDQVARYPDLRQAIDRYIEGVASQAQQAIACRAWHSAEQRFCRWLLTAADHAGRDELELTQEFMGHMLGVQRQSVSMIAGAMRQRGLIHYGRGRISIRDHAALADHACECLDHLRERWDEIWGAPLHLRQVIASS